MHLVALAVDQMQKRIWNWHEGVAQLVHHVKKAQFTFGCDRGH